VIRDWNGPLSTHGDPLIDHQSNLITNHEPRITNSRMSEKKAYPLRINADVLAAAQRWADDELRSLNAQIEYVLRDALRKTGRLKSPGDEDTPETDDGQ